MSLSIAVGPCEKVGYGELVYELIKHTDNKISVMKEFAVAQPFATTYQRINVRGRHLNIYQTTMVLRTGFVIRLLLGICLAAMLCN